MIYKLKKKKIWTATTNNLKIYGTIEKYYIQMTFELAKS